MSAVAPVSSGWLALREPEDARARSGALATAAAALVRPGLLVVHDLGSGTGSMMRWLAPRLSGPQRWVLHDRQPDLVETALDAARPRDADGRPVTVGSRLGELGELGDLTATDLAGAGLATASALLDVLTAAELDAVVDACVGAGVPALLALSVTGEVRLDPPDDGDEAVRAAFNAHQRRTVGDRTLLGPEGGDAARSRFAAAGWRVRTESTPWRLGPRDPRLLADWFGGWVGAAREQEPSLWEPGRSLQTERAARLRNGTLVATVEHVDLLAWPA